MSRMTIQILGRDYTLACDDGQEAHLGKLAQMMNERAKKLQEQMGRAPENTLLVMAGLMLADELSDSHRAVKHLTTKLHKAEETSGGSLSQEKLAEMEAVMATTIHDIAARVESLAGRVAAL